MTIKKKGGKHCVVHGSPKKKGSKTDKPKGTVIACHKTKKAAVAQHQAIAISKKKRKGGK